MNTFFISDLHLQPEREDLVQAFFQFLERELQDNDTLYILGDFFDAWIGDDEDHPFYIGIKEKLATLADRLIDVYFMHGNRDFLVKERFAQEARLSLIDDPTLIDLAGKRVLLMHGDSLCTGDMQYQTFRDQVRSHAWQHTILSMPLPQRRALAAEMRRKSLSMNSNKAEDIMDVAQEEVDRVIEEHHADILLHGHTHRPARHKLANKKERIVLGDWDKKGWFVKADDFKITLCNFDI